MYKNHRGTGAARLTGWSTRPQGGRKPGMTVLKGVDMPFAMPTSTYGDVEPTDKQLRFAHVICKTLNVGIHEDCLSSRKAMMAFLDYYAPRLEAHKREATEGSAADQ